MLGKIYGFEWLAGVSFLATTVFFLTGPVSTQYFRLASMTLVSLSKIALISIGLILAVKTVSTLRDRTSFKDGIRSSELAQKRFWTDVGRILISFSIIQTSHLTLKLYIPVINPTNNDRLLHQIDTALFGGRDPVQMVIDFFVSPYSMRVMDAMYSGFYFFLLWGGVVLYFSSLEGRSRIAFFNSYLLMWQLGLLFYVLLPSWGPAFVRPEAFFDTLQNMPATVHVQRSLVEETQSIVSGNYNIVVHFFGLAAFPSLHVGVFVLFSLWARPISRAWLLWNLTFLVIIFLGSMLTGYHYLIDGIGGALVAAFSYIVGRRRWPIKTAVGGGRQATSVMIEDEGD